MKPHTLFFLLFLSAKAFAQTSTVNVYFKTDSYALDEIAMARIDSLWKTGGAGRTFSLAGYCDNRASDDHNNTLSLKRARSVFDYMMELGAKKETFSSIKGLGETQPINENKDETDWQQNRRVEILVLKNSETGNKLKDQVADTTTIVGTNIILRNINFQGGMHHFLPASMPALIELLEVMHNFPRLSIQVEGHICCEPGNEDGVDMETGIRNLSEARAKAVRDYLIQNGIDPKRITYRGFGHSAPIHPYPESSEEEMVENRRVEIKIVSK
jgi:outer membrane protein OmpA-like peptidoglycan-associated protein